MASGARNLNEVQRQMDTFISREKGLKERVINQGGGVEINLKGNNPAGLNILSLLSNFHRGHILNT